LVGKLWADHKDKLQALPGSLPGLYGVMWYTDESHKRYFYMLAVQMDNRDRDPVVDGIERLDIPGSLFAVASVPEGMDMGEAWGDFYYKDLPARGLETDHQHGIFLEWYPENGIIELWNPVKS